MSKDASSLTHLSDEITQLSENSLPEESFDRVGDADAIETLLTEVRRLFVKQCEWIIYSLAVIWTTETALIVFKFIKPSDRIFTERVLITIIGATIVQVGVIIATAVRSKGVTLAITNKRKTASGYKKEV